MPRPGLTIQCGRMLGRHTWRQHHSSLNHFRHVHFGHTTNITDTYLFTSIRTGRSLLRKPKTNMDPLRRKIQVVPNICKPSKIPCEQMAYQKYLCGFIRLCPSLCSSLRRSHNEAGTSGIFAPGKGLGSVDIYTWDAYPQRYDCGHPDIWHEVITNYDALHQVDSKVVFAFRCKPPVTCLDRRSWSPLGDWRISGWLPRPLGRGKFLPGSTMSTLSARRF